MAVIASAQSISGSRPTPRTVTRSTRLSPKERIKRFWEEDRGLTVLLGFISVVAFVIAPWAETRPGGGTILRVCVSLMFASGAYVLAPHRRNRVAILAVTAVPILCGWLEEYTDSRFWSAAAAISSCLFALVLSAFVVRRVFKPGPITVHRVVGSIVVYLLLGIAFGDAARLVKTLDPEAYRSGTFARVERAELYYFSFVTLTTVGYGDITPVHPPARALAILEALTGQLFPSILIARLVSQELMTRESRPD